jgi:uncharacterized phage protein gp47/JayE
MSSIPTVQEIKEQVLSDIESELNGETPSLPVSVFEIIAVAIGGALYSVYKFGQWIRRQIFVITADDDAVLERGNEYGLTPTPATKGLFQATLTGVDGTVINSGEIFTKGNFAYETTNLAVISGGVATVTFEPLLFGSDSNLLVSDELELSTPIIGLDNIATITQVIVSGSNQESINDFKQRIINRQQTPPQGGSVPDYVQWSTEVPGIVEAFPFRVAPGNIVVYGITNDNTDETTRIPDSSKRTELETYLNDPKRKPMNDNVTVQAQTNVGFVVTGQNLVPNTGELRTAIENAIFSYLLSRRPNLYPDATLRLDNITESDIYAIASLSGARSVELSVELTDTTPVVNYNLDDNELAFLDSIVWV